MKVRFKSELFPCVRGFHEDVGIGGDNCLEWLASLSLGALLLVIDCVALPAALLASIKIDKESK